MSMDGMAGDDTRLLEEIAEVMGAEVSGSPRDNVTPV
jgi:hypothetical protein